MMDQQKGDCFASGCDKPRKRRGNRYGSIYCAMHACRLARGSPAGLEPQRKFCLQCGTRLQQGRSKYCSHQCCVRYLRRTPQQRSCIVCGSRFVTWHRGTICSPKCKKENYQINNNRRRVREAAAATNEKFSREEIFKRDRWRCQICGGRVDRKAKPHTPLAPTLDHIVPLSKGGVHSRVNSQCAHFRCNAKKHTRTLGQMRLFG